MDVDTRERFGSWLKERRLERSLSAKLLAEKAGISQSYVTELEKARRQVSRNIAAQLAAALGLDKSVAWREAGFVFSPPVPAVPDLDSELLVNAIKAAQELTPKVRDILYESWLRGGAEAT